MAGAATTALVSADGALRGTLLACLGLVGLTSLYLGWAGRLAPAEALGLGVVAGMIAASVSRMLSLQNPAPVLSRHEAATECLGDLVTWHTTAGAVLAAHAPAASAICPDTSALHGQGLFERVHVADRPLFLKTLSDAAHGEGVVAATLRLHGCARAASPSDLFHVDMRARRLATHDRPDATVVAVMHDVTLRRQAEDDRDHMARQTETAAAAKGNFLATVSHELRTPLNAIIGFSEILSSETLRPDAEAQRLEYAQIIHASGHHLLEVVNALLDMSRIESGGMTLDPEPVDLAALVNGCCDLMAIRASQASIVFERVTGDGVDQVVCDRRAMKQIVINLLSNAIKFTPAGGTVTIAVVLDGQMVDLSVSDTGIGINAEDLPQLGQPFFQAKGSYDRAYEGTGLGLSVVRGLAGLHGGSLEIESAPGAGTRVSLRIPVAGTSAKPEPVQIATHAKSPRKGLLHREPYRLTA